MDLTIDYTIAIQIVTFVLLWAVLKRVVFDPFSRTLEEREARTQGAHARAARATEEAARARLQHEQAVQAARTEAARQAELARKAAREEQERMIAEAREEAAGLLAQRRDELRRQIAGARQALLGDAERVAAEMLRRVTDGAAS